MCQRSKKAYKKLALQWHPVRFSAIRKNVQQGRRHRDMGLGKAVGDLIHSTEESISTLKADSIFDLDGVCFSCFLNRFAKELLTWLLQGIHSTKCRFSYSFPRSFALRIPFFSFFYVLSSSR